MIWRVNVLLSHVLTALPKCPPSICAQSEVNNRFKRSAADSGCLIAVFFFVCVVFEAFVRFVVGGLGGIAGRDRIQKRPSQSRCIGGFRNAMIISDPSQYGS